MNLVHRKALIKKCRPQDKKPGRKYPESRQEFCLWDRDEEEILMAGPKSAVEQQEKNVQYFKHQGDVCIVVRGNVYRQSSEVPHPPHGWQDHLRVGYSAEQVFEKIISYIDRIGRKVEEFNAQMGEFVTMMDRRQPINYPSWGEAFGSTMDSDKFGKFAGQGVEALQKNSEFSQQAAEALQAIKKRWGIRNQLLKNAYDMEEQLSKEEAVSPDHQKAYRIRFDQLEAMQKDYKKTWRGME